MFFLINYISSSLAPYLLKLYSEADIVSVFVCFLILQAVFSVYIKLNVSQ